VILTSRVKTLRERAIGYVLSPKQAIRAGMWLSMRKVATLAQFLAQSVRRMFAAGGDGGTIWGLE